MGKLAFHFLFTILIFFCLETKHGQESVKMDFFVNWLPPYLSPRLFGKFRREKWAFCVSCLLTNWVNKVANITNFFELNLSFPVFKKTLLLCHLRAWEWWSLHSRTKTHWAKIDFIFLLKFHYFYANNSLKFDKKYLRKKENVIYP